MTERIKQANLASKSGKLLRKEDFDNKLKTNTSYKNESNKLYQKMLKRYQYKD